MIARKVLFAQVMLGIGYILGLFSWGYLYTKTKESLKNDRRTPRRTGLYYGDPTRATEPVTVKTNHSMHIQKLRSGHDAVNALCADLLEMHDHTGISLDNWEMAKAVIEPKIGRPITPNFA